MKININKKYLKVIYAFILLIIVCIIIGWATLDFPEAERFSSIPFATRYFIIILSLAGLYVFIRLLFRKNKK